jgi:chromosome segregation ATPase
LDSQNDEARIDADPTSAAQHFLKLLRTVQKEYKILQVAQDKLQFTYDELRSKCEDLKIEARESAQEVMNMEGEINDLREANEKLVRDLEQARGE